MAWAVVGASAAIVGTGATLVGMQQGAQAGKREKKRLKAQGKAEQAGKYFAAKQMDQAAKAEEATGSTQASEELRKMELMQSRALAIAGASGAGADDPNVSRIIGDIAVEGQLAAQTQLYNGQEAARNWRIGAKIARWEGDQARKGLNVSANAVNDVLKQQRVQTVVSIANTSMALSSSLRSPAPPAKTPAKTQATIPEPF